MRVFIKIISVVVSSIFLISSCSDDPQGFEILPIDQKLQNEMISKNTFASYSPVTVDRLKLIRVKYINFENEERTGELIVMDACSEQVRQIFIELHKRNFPLADVSLMPKFNGSDSLSMAHNNTSVHNLRTITGKKRLSLHAYGTAIDINPVNNPFIDIPCDDSLGIARVEPIAGMKYINRRENRLGKKNRKGMAEEVVDIFAKNGFYWWGGYWNCPIDYQHFQISRSISELLSIMKPDEAKDFFKKVQSYYNETGRPVEDAIDKEMSDDSSIKEFYERNPKEFERIIEKVFRKL